MTDNSSYRGGQGQGRPDEYYDERYARPQEDPRGGPHGGPDPRGGYPPEAGGYPPQPGYPPPRPQDQGGYPEQGGYPDQRGYQDQGGYPDQRGYPEQGGYPPSYEQRPPAPGGYGAQGYDQGYRQGGGYGQPPGGQPGYGGYGEYGREPARQDEGAYSAPAAPSAPPEAQRPGYPDQGGGYDQGYQQVGAGYGRPEYGQGDYTQYADTSSPGDYPPQGAGYADPAGRDYEYGQAAAPDYGQAPPDYGQAPSDYGQAPPEYGQPAGGGYGGYGQSGYGATGSSVILQLDDGSGRTYQLRDGSNIIGRGQDAQFRLPDTGVSRRHLEIRWDGQVALLADLNSTNGTTVNNAPVQEWQLADGDVIRLGHSEIIVRIH